MLRYLKVFNFLCFFPKCSIFEKYSIPEQTSPMTTFILLLVSGSTHLDLVLSKSFFNSSSNSFTVFLSPSISLHLCKPLYTTLLLFGFSFNFSSRKRNFCNFVINFLADPVFLIWKGISSSTFTTLLSSC